VADRWEVERALRSSGLHPNARFVAMMLLSRADAGTAEIPSRFSPSLSVLAADTGLARSTVAVALNALEASGWVTRARDAARARAEKLPTGYRLHVPDGQTPRPTAGLGPERAKPTSPIGGLVRDTDQSASPGHGPALVRDTDSTSPGGGHNQNIAKPLPDQEHSRGARDPYLTLPGFAEFWSVYPRKIAKRAAAKAYRTALNRCSGEPALIVKAAAAYRDDTSRDDRFTAYPATWLNDDRWTDERPASKWDRAMERAQARATGGR
jgi:hypothetical protein